MRKSTIKKLVLGLMFPAAFGLNANAFGSLRARESNSRWGVSHSLNYNVQEQHTLIEAARSGDLMNVEQQILKELMLMQ